LKKNISFKKKFLYGAPCVCVCVTQRFLFSALPLCISPRTPPHFPLPVVISRHFSSAFLPFLISGCRFHFNRNVSYSFLESTASTCFIFPNVRMQFPRGSWASRHCHVWSRYSISVTRSLSDIEDATTQTCSHTSSGSHVSPESI